jgi:hypothetical protein
MFALQITTPLLYSQTLDLTFTAQRRRLFEDTWKFTKYEQSQVRDGVTPASKSAWVFFIKCV